MRRGGREKRSGKATCVPGAARGLRTVEAHNSRARGSSDARETELRATRINNITGHSLVRCVYLRISNASRRCHERACGRAKYCRVNHYAYIIYVYTITRNFIFHARIFPSIARIFHKKRERERENRSISFAKKNSQAYSYKNSWVIDVCVSAIFFIPEIRSFSIKSDLSKGMKTARAFVYRR